MSEETTVTTEGQPDAAPATGSGQESAGTTASQKPTEPTAGAEVEVTQFYDPKEVPPELQGSFKRMQGSYTKAMQEANSYKEKVKAYDEFMADPVTSLQRIAAANGYQLTRAQAEAQIAQQQEANEPTTWDEVYKTAEERAEQRILEKLRPYLSEIEKVKKSQIESLLDDSYPEWRAHEPEMKQLLAKHPTLANDPTTLVELAIPKEVRESQATQKALEILKKKADAAQLGSGSTTTKTANPKPDKPISFNEAVAFAKEKLAREGKAA